LAFAKAAALRLSAGRLATGRLTALIAFALAEAALRKGC
jgi:hypothetical protein